MGFTVNSASSGLMTDSPRAPLERPLVDHGLSLDERRDDMLFAPEMKEDCPFPTSAASVMSLTVAFSSPLVMMTWRAAPSSRS